MNKKKEMYLVLLGISDDLAFSRGRKVCLLGSDAFLKSIEMARKAVPFSVCVLFIVVKRNLTVGELPRM